MENDFEKWLKKALFSGELIPGQKLHSESFFEEKFKVSKSTILKTIKKYESLGILVSFQGKGVFVSTLWEKDRSNFRFIPIKDDLVNDMKNVVKLSKLNWDSLKAILNKLNIEYVQSDWDFFYKFHYSKNDEILCYSLNWLNKQSKLSAKYFEKNPNAKFEEVFKLSFVQNKIESSAPTLKDKEILGLKNNCFIISSTSYLFENSIIPTLIRVIKIKPENFFIEHKILKNKFK